MATTETPQRPKYHQPGSFPIRAPISRLTYSIRSHIQCEQGRDTLWDEKQRCCNAVIAIIEVEGEKYEKRSEAEAPIGIY